MISHSRRHAPRALASAVSLALVATAASAEPAASPTVTGLGEIVVTASKREERLQDVPSSVTALTADTLETRGITQFADYVSAVPGLSTYGGAAPGFGQVILRGINTGAQQTSATVGFYLDETPFVANGALSLSATVTPDPDLSDIERIEVLRGPQSTLYGASALGGLVKIVTRRPDPNAFSGEVRLTGNTVTDGSSGYGVRASLNVPLIDERLALRVAGFYRTDPGFIDNVRTGGTDVNEAQVQGGRVSLRYQSSDSLDITLSGLIQDITADGASNVFVNRTTLQPVFGDLTYSAYRDTAYESDYRVGNLTVNADFGWASLLSSSSYSTADNSQVLDYTAIYGFLLASIPGAGVFAELAPNSQKLTQEFRLTSPSSTRFEWLAGAIYTKEENDYSTFLRGVTAATGAPLPGPLANVFTTVIDSTYDEYAVFGDVTFYVSPDVDFTLGARYSRNTQDFVAPTSGVLNGNVTTVRTNESDDDSTTYLATARWRVTPAVNLYARAASAYRPGGPQTRAVPGLSPTFEPDTLWNYEVGAKGTFLDNRLTTDVAIYYIDWKDIQLNALVGGFTILGNGGEAKSQGIEFTAAWRPIDPLALSAGAAYNDTELKSVPANVTAATGATPGDTLPNSPKFTANVNADYTFPAFGAWTGLLGATYAHQGSRYTSFSGDTLNTRLELPSFDTIGLRVGLQSERFDVIARADNLGDERGYMSGGVSRILAAQNVPATLFVIRPRTYSLTLTARF